MEQKKTVLFTIDNFHLGGVTSFLRNYINILLEEGNEVIILGFADDLQNPEAYYSGCKVIVIPGKINFSISGKIKNFVTYLYYLNKVLINFKQISTIHFSTTISSFYCLAHPLTWTKHRVITFYGSYALERKSMGSNSKMRTLLRNFFQLIVLKSSNVIVTFSKYSKNIILSTISKSLKNKIVIIPGYIDIKSQSKYVSKKTINLLNFGRAEPRKGLEVLLNATKILLESNFKVKTVIASPISYLVEYVEMLEAYENLNLFDSVHFIHAINVEQKKILLENADLFVIPSQDLETFGLTILEALSYGVVVVGTPVGAIPDILTKIDKRLVCADKSSQSLAKTISWFIKLPIPDKNKLQQKAKHILEKFYSKTACKSKILNIYR